MTSQEGRDPLSHLNAGSGSFTMFARLPASGLCSPVIKVHQNHKAIHLHLKSWVNQHERCAVSDFDCAGRGRRARETMNRPQDLRGLGKGTDGNSQLQSPIH